MVFGSDRIGHDETQRLESTNKQISSTCDLFTMLLGFVRLNTAENGLFSLDRPICHASERPIPARKARTDRYRRAVDDSLYSLRYTDFVFGLNDALIDWLLPCLLHLFLVLILRKGTNDAIHSFTHS